MHSLGVLKDTSEFLALPPAGQLQAQKIGFWVLGNQQYDPGRLNAKYLTHQWGCYVTAVATPVWKCAPTTSGLVPCAEYFRPDIRVFKVQNAAVFAVQMCCYIRGALLSFLKVLCGTKPPLEDSHDFSLLLIFPVTRKTLNIYHPVSKHNPAGFQLVNTMPAMSESHETFH